MAINGLIGMNSHMKGTILITDTLFIFPEHEELIRNAGYEIERLDKPNAAEEELIQAVTGKAGYVLGGIEKITDKVIDAADQLKVIVFTGVDHRFFIPGYAKATQRGIVISSTPRANTFAVAEYTVASILAMTRNLFELGRTGKKKFETTYSLHELTIGIIGMGNIGSKVAQVLQDFGAKEVRYYSRTRKPEIEQKGIRFMSVEELLSQCDIVSLHTSKEAGEGFIGKNELAVMKDGALIVNCGFTGGINKDALFEELKVGRLRAVQDDPIDERFDSLPLSVWFNSNSHTAYNTHEANKTASDMATKSLLNLLATGKDEYRVN
jgi:phosphoglycerate dehydrogenase-like enzyme